MPKINKLNKRSIEYFRRNGFLILRKVLKKKDLDLINKRLKFLEKKQKNGRGLSEPGIKKSLIHSLKNDEVLYPIIEEKNWFKETLKKMLNCEEIVCWNAKSNLKKRWYGSAEYYHQDNVYREKLNIGEMYSFKYSTFKSLSLILYLIAILLSFLHLISKNA